MTERPQPVVDDRAGAGPKARWIVFAALALALALYAGPAIRALAGVYRENPDCSHGPLVIATALAMMWRLRHRVAATPVGAGWPGLGAILLGGLLGLMAHWYMVALQPGYLGHLFLQALSLLVTTAGILCVYLGWRCLCVLAPAVGFLSFAMPLPDSVVLPLATRMQHGVAMGAEAVMRALGGVVFRDGALLYLPGQTLGVAEACSGMRSLAVLPAFAVACAWFMRIRATRALWIVAATPLLALASNILRVSALGAMALRGVDESRLDTAHAILGQAGVVLGGAVVLGLCRLLREPSPRAVGEGAPAHGPALAVTRPVRASHVAAIVLLMAAAAMMQVVDYHYRHALDVNTAAPVDRLAFTEFPRDVGTWSGCGERELFPVEQKMLEPTDAAVRYYRGRDGTTIELILLYWAPYVSTPGQPAPSGRAHSPEWCHTGAGWVLQSTLDAAKCRAWLPRENVEAWLFSKDDRQRIVLFWQSGSAPVGRLFVPQNLVARLQRLVHSWREPLRAVVSGRYAVSIAADVRAHPADARQAAMEFSRALAPLLPTFGIDRPGEERVVLE